MGEQRRGQERREKREGQTVFNVYFSVVNLWLSSHIWLFRLVSSRLGSGSASRSDPARCSPQRHVTLSVRVVERSK
ncbi:hypothetical protein EYF80_002294 [Liparis tanakae]|uniref:Uncharacterized protein n=1 Tax=Liparis tanakae TaxID=230148 RepID=A0A4Z2JC36_9TELE|nr:hypothetical protein EYF80_002294 [Liparis tanakae]